MKAAESLSMRNAKQCLRWALLALSLLSPLAVHAEDTHWPRQPLHLVVGFAAGGPTDLLARSLGKSLAQGLGQPVIVENKAGANTIIAADYVAHAQDQHTLLMGATNHSMIAALYSRQIHFDPVDSFEPLCRIAATPTVLVVGPESGLNTLQDFLNKARAQPGVLSYASPGLGSSVHFAAEQFSQLAGVRLNHVPYKGAAPALADVMSGQVDASFASLGSVQGLIQSGKLRALAVATPARLPSLPSLPTFEESGLHGYSADAWYGVLAPKGLPAAAVERLQTEIRRFAQSAAALASFQNQGLEPALLCGAPFAAALATESRNWTQLAQKLHLQNP